MNCDYGVWAARRSLVVKEVSQEPASGGVHGFSCSPSGRCVVFDGGNGRIERPVWYAQRASRNRTVYGGLAAIGVGAGPQCNECNRWPSRGSHEGAGTEPRNGK